MKKSHICVYLSALIVTAFGFTFAPTGNPLTGIFGAVDGAVTAPAYRMEVYGANAPLTSVAPWTVTLTNNTVARASLTGRPALGITHGNTGATDKTTYFISAAPIIIQNNKRIRIRGTVLLAAGALADLEFGIGVVGTDPIGTPPTDYIAIRKLSAETVFSLVSRKASGTNQLLALGTPVLAAATWYEFEMYIIQNTGSVAGSGHIEVYFGPSSAGTNLPQVAVVDLPNNFPDTVAMAPFFEDRAGATDALVDAVGYFTTEVEL